MFDKSTKTLITVGLVLLATFAFIGVELTAEEDDAATFTVSATSLGHSTVTLSSGSQTQSSHGGTATITVTTGSTVTFTAAMDVGYRFNGWATDNSFVSYDNPYSSTFSTSANLYAGELEVTGTYTVSFSAGTGGSVSPTTISGIPYGSPISVNSNTITIDGSSVTAYASAGYSFDSWSNATGTITENRTITASFTASTYTVYFDANSGGSVSRSSITNVPYGASVSVSDNKVTINGTTVTATPSSGHTFTYWDNATGPITGDKRITANFDTSTYTVTFSASPSNFGSVSRDYVYNVPYGSYFSVNGTRCTINGTAVTATAATDTAEYDYSFDGWSVTSSTRVTGDKTVLAYFDRSTQTYSVSFSAGTGGSVSPTTVNSVPYGTSMTVNNNVITINGTTVTATPDTNYSFSSWSNATGTITGTRTVTANFTQSNVTVSAKASAHATVTITSGSQSTTASYGNTATMSVPLNGYVTFSAVMDQGYYCPGWENMMGVLVSQDATFTTTVSSDLNIMNGEYPPVVVTFDATTNGGTLVGDSQRTYTFNDLYGTLPSATKAAENFLGWFTSASGGTEITASSRMTYLVDTTLYAQFSNTAVTVSAKASDHATVTITSGQESSTASYGSTATLIVAENSSVTFSAVMDQGYYCPGWENIMSVLVSEENPFTTRATTDLSLMNGEYPPVVVSFDATTNGGTLVGDSQRTYTFNDLYGTLPSATKAAENFLGWFTSASGGTEITASSRMTFLVDTTLYAQFTDTAVTVSAKASAHATVTITSGSQSATTSYGNTATLTVAENATVVFAAVMDQGYYCPGWENIMGVLVSEENPFTTSATTDLSIMNGEYPPVVVTFDATTNGGTLQGDYQRTYTFNDYFGELPLATKTDDPFIGWFTASSGGDQITHSTRMTFIEDTTLYAQFLHGPTTPDVWWNNNYVNGSVDIAFDFSGKTDCYTHEMSIPLVIYDGIEDNGDGIKYFSASGYTLNISVSYNSNIVCTLTGHGQTTEGSFKSGTWVQFTLGVDAQKGTVTFNGTRSMGWNTNQQFTFTNYETVFSKEIFSFSDVVDSLAIYNIYHEDTGNGTVHPRFQVSATTTFLDTYGFVMVDPTLNVYQQFPNYNDLRLNLYSFAVYGDSITINGHTMNMSGSVIADLYYTTYKNDDGTVHYVIATESTEGAIQYEATLSNVYITWTNISSQTNTDRQCTLTFVNDKMTIEMGSFDAQDLTISMTGVWYFTTALYEPYTATETHFSMDWNSWFNLSGDAFILAIIALLVILTAAFGAIWKPSLIDYAIIVGGGVVAYILIGGL